MNEVNTKPKLIDVALAHLALERAAACVLPVPETDPPLFVAVGPAPAIVKLLQEEASPELPDLDHLESLARAADPHGAVHLITHYRNSADTKAEEAWRQAATPASMLALIALARRAQGGEAPQAARPPATGDEPHGYWYDGEWYGYHPDERACNFAVGSTVELTPVWTHGQAAMFNVVGSEDSDDVSLVPATPADAALCNWTETPATAAQHAESGAQAAIAQASVEVEFDHSEGGHHD